MLASKVAVWFGVLCRVFSSSFRDDNRRATAPGYDHRLSRTTIWTLTFFGNPVMDAQSVRVMQGAAFAV